MSVTDIRIRIRIREYLKSHIRYITSMCAWHSRDQDPVVRHFHSIYRLQTLSASVYVCVYVK